MEKGNNINTGNQPAPDNGRAAALDSISNDMNSLIFSYKLVHKYKSLFCSYYEEINGFDSKIHPPKVECHFLIGRDVTVFFNVVGEFAKKYDLKELIQLCSSWENLGAWYKQYNEQTLNGTMYDE